VMVYPSGKTQSGDFVDNRLVAPPSSKNLWELPDNEVVTMLNQAANDPNQTKYLDAYRVAVIKNGWREGQISDRDQAIATALDYLLRVNTMYNARAVAGQRLRGGNADFPMQRYFADIRRQEDRQKARDIAEGEQRLENLKHYSAAQSFMVRKPQNKSGVSPSAKPK